MPTDLLSYLTPILTERVRNLENEILMRRPEYRKLQERIIASHETIKEFCRRNVGRRFLLGMKRLRK